MKRMWTAWSPGKRRATFVVGSLGFALIMTLIAWPTSQDSSYSAERATAPHRQYQTLALSQNKTPNQLPSGQVPEVPWAGAIPLVTIALIGGSAYRQQHESRSSP